MSTDIMLGGYNERTITSAPGGQAPNLAGCNAVVFDNTFPVGTVGTNWWDWQPFVPAPVPTYPAYPSWRYYSNTHCCKCSAKAIEEFAKMLGATHSPIKGSAPMATPTVADTLLTQAKGRIDEIQKRLDEVPALEAEIARLRRMVDAAEGK